MKQIDKALYSNSQGYNIISVSEDVWAFEIIGIGSFMGSFQEIVKFALISYSFDINEIDFALQEMVKEDHNSCHFGMWGRFIFSFSKDFNIERKAS